MVFDPDCVKLVLSEAENWKPILDSINKEIKAGTRTFDEMLANVSKDLGDIGALIPALQFLWGEAGKTNPKLNLPPPIIGRPDLAQFNEFMNLTDALRNQAGLPEVQTREDSISRARVRLEADYEGEKVELLRKGRAGEQLSADDTYVAKGILDREWRGVDGSATPEGLANLVQIQNAYRQTGTTQGRAFGARANIGTHAERIVQAIRDSLLTPPERDIERMKGASPDEINNILNDWAAQIEAIRKRLLGMGVDLGDLDTLLDDPVRAAQTLGTINAAKADPWSPLYEFWRNSILSSPSTQVANLSGSVFAAFNLTVERTIEGMVDLAVSAIPGIERKGVRFGEVNRIFKGAWRSIGEGFANFMKTWRSELPFFESSLGRDPTSKLDDPSRQARAGPRIAIQGGLGRVIRMPQRLLLAADDFMKTIIARAEVAAVAYRMAVNEGLEGSDIEARIDALMTDTESEAWNAAIDKARELTFVEDMGIFGELALNARRKIPFPAFFIMPFITTPVNIFKQALKRSPLGGLLLAKRIAGNLLKAMSNIRKQKSYTKGILVTKFDNLTSLIAQQLLSWGVLLMLYATNDEDDPWITGASEVRARDRSRREAAFRSFKPLSIRAGGIEISYARIEPFATSLGLIVDAVNFLKGNDPDESVIDESLKSLLRQLNDKTFLQGLSDMAKAFDPEDENARSRLTRNFVASWVPNIARTAIRSATQDVIVENRVWGDSVDKSTRNMDRMLHRTELRLLDSLLQSEARQPKIDLWGRDIPVGNALGSSIPWQMIVPIRVFEQNTFFVDVILSRWNNENPDDERYPSTPLPSVSTTIRGKSRKIFFSGEEYTRFLREAGEESVRRLEKLKDLFNMESPTLRDVNRIRVIIRASRKRVKAQKWFRQLVRDGREKLLAQ